MTASPAPARRSVPRPWRVLLVDGDRWHRACAAAALAEQGCDVIEARGLGAARYALERGTFDAVVTELRLGDGDGFAVFQAVRRAGQSAPVQVITGMSLATGSAAPRTIWFSNQAAPAPLFEAIHKASLDSTQRTHRRCSRATMPIPAIAYAGT
jgi:DNA-binding NtrC family response regulator